MLIECFDHFSSYRPFRHLSLKDIIWLNLTSILNNIIRTGNRLSKANKLILETGLIQNFNKAFAFLRWQS